MTPLQLAARLANVMQPGPGLQETLSLPYGPDPRHLLDVYQARVPGGPLAVFFYGGTWQGGSRAYYRFLGRALAAGGATTVIADYRLYPQIRYPEFLNDCALATAFVRDNAARLGADRTRIFAMGHSAGAYNALMLAANPAYLLRATGELPNAVLAGAIGLAGPYDFLPMTGPDVRAVFGGAADDPDTQPIAHIGRHAPPLLLLTGEADTTVLPRNSERLAAAAKSFGVPAQLRRYPGIGHIGILAAFFWPFRFRAPALADSLAFLTNPAMVCAAEQSTGAQSPIEA
jgi:acetyl esterase/lipase